MKAIALATAAVLGLAACNQNDAGNNAVNAADNALDANAAEPVGNVAEGDKPAADEAAGNAAEGDKPADEAAPADGNEAGDKPS